MVKKYFLEIRTKESGVKSTFGDMRGTKYFKSKKDAKMFEQELKNDPEVGSDFRKDTFYVREKK